MEFEKIDNFQQVMGSHNLLSTRSKDNRKKLEGIERITGYGAKL